MKKYKFTIKLLASCNKTEKNASNLIDTGHTVLRGLSEYGAVKPDTPIFRKVQGSNSANLSREQISVSRKPRRTKHATDGPMLVNESPKKYVLNLKYVF